MKPEQKTAQTKQAKVIVGSMFKKIFSTKNEPLVTSSQDHLPIADIVDSILVFKDGGAAMVLESTSLNFGLLSSREQEAVITAYAAFINSLSFAAQVVIRTQKKDITRYMDYLSEKATHIKDPKLQTLFQSYKNFVIETTKKRNVLGKRFFIVIPFSPFELGVKSSMSSFGQGKKTLPFTKKFVVKKAKIALGPKKDHVSRQAARLGLRLRQLNNTELTKLFYDIYNPNVETVKLSQEEKDADGLNEKEAFSNTGQQNTQHIANAGFVPTQ